MPRMLLRPVALVVMSLALPVAARAETRVEAQLGNDLWSRRVEQTWLPLTRAVMARFDELALREYGQKEGETFHVVLASEGSAKLPPEGAAEAVFRLEAGMRPAELRTRALRWPAVEAALALERQLAQGQAARVPVWLRYGLAELVASQLLDERQEPRVYSPEAIDQLMGLRGVPDAEHRRLSLALVSLLQDRMGADFHPAMARYFKAAAVADFDAEKAFAAAFGQGTAEYLERSKSQLAQVPPTADAGTRTPPASEARITVQMGGHVDDEFAQAVQREWLPVVRQAADQFDDLVRQSLRLRLRKDVHIYVAAGKGDYEQVLTQDMGGRASTAGLHAQVTGGLTNRRDQIAIKFEAGASLQANVRQSVRTTLHELTHELQLQVGFGYYGFTPPEWMTEGSADLMAYLLEDRVQLAGLARTALPNWRLQCLDWYRKYNSSKLEPDDIVDVSNADWLRMTSERRGNYPMAGLMAMYLQAIKGDEFLQDWVRYYLQAGQQNLREGAAFEQSFGISERDFLADFKRWLAQQ